MFVPHQVQHLLDVAMDGGEDFGFGGFRGGALFGLEAVTRFQYAVAELLSTDDADQFHVVGLTRGVSRRFELENGELEGAQQGSFDEGDVLNVFERNGFLHGDNDALAVAEIALAQFAEQPVEIVASPPLAQAQQPEGEQHNADDGDGEQERDVQHKVGADERIEGGALKDAGVGKLGHLSVLPWLPQLSADIL